MNRRDFLSLSALLAARHCTGAETLPHKPITRAAVVIGVNKVGNLPVLHAAAEGAEEMARWLEKENFVVTLLTDKINPVTGSEISAAIAALVRIGTLDQLVVYFSGHGCIISYSEYWLLSGAPTDANEAVSLLESVMLSRESGIGNIVFISDACRSRTDSLGCERVRGRLIFPNIHGAGRTDTKVDLFLATRVGDVALEVPVANSAGIFKGIFTTAFLSAFVSPYPDMVKNINGERIIPNDRLEEYLKKEVRRRAEEQSILLNQTPYFEITSGDSTYLGRLRSREVPTTPVPGLDPPNSSDTKRLALVNQAIEEILSTENPLHFETECGISVTGTRVRAIYSGSRIKTKFLQNWGGGRSAAWVYLDGHPGASVCVQFENGNGTVIAVLNGYIANIHVSDSGVANVGYVPSSNSWRWSGQGNEQRLARLRAIIAAKTRYGEFLIDEGKNRRQSAMELADKIRVMKRVDPTLGIYAAYAYSVAGLPEEIESVKQYMSSDLRLEISDVAMLAGDLAKDGAQSKNVFPFCPMLAQGWGLLRIKAPQISATLDSLRDFLKPSLWTTLNEKGVEIVAQSLLADKLA